MVSTISLLVLVFCVEETTTTEGTLAEGRVFFYFVFKTCRGFSVTSYGRGIHINVCAIGCLFGDGYVRERGRVTEKEREEERGEGGTKKEG